MADDRAYRIWVAYAPDKERFKAHVPELDLEVEAGTRADALAEIESAIESRVEELATAGSALPPAVDAVDAPLTLTVQLAGPLARSLRFLAREQGMTPEDLAAQLVTHGLGRLEGRRETPIRTPEPERRDPPRDEDDAAGKPRRRGRGRGRGRREGYRPDIEDQASFLAYVRDMEKGGGGGRR